MKPTPSTPPSRKDEYNYLPEGLPIPEDDGACNHLLGMELPSVELLSTSGELVDPSKATSKYVVIFCYPMTGSPTNKLLWDNEEEWNAIPGACGCTSQACSFRDTISLFKDLDATVFGLSNNSPDYQKEAADRLELEYELLSDEQMKFAAALKLPTFQFHDLTLLKRVTLIAQNNKIVKVFYPIFPPNTDAGKVLAWLGKEVKSDAVGKA
ncbi:MAG TPA: peroxiredoxin [Candidatus Saccharimonadales bacterium]|nr:peroxiredoxin [Candidatus Saccharimonadales bacterium]